MKIEGLIFDLGGTLIEYAGPFASWPELETPGLQAAYHSLAEKDVALPEFERFKAAGFEILPGRWQMAVNGRRNLRLTDFLSEVLVDCGVQGVQKPWLEEAAVLYEKAVCSQAFALQDAQQTLQAIKDEGYKLGLLSNTMFSGEAHIADLERFSLDYFDAMLFSADAGQWKPSPDPYHALLDQLEIKPQHGVFIGDDPANDMVGAQATGLRTILIRSSQRFPHPADVRPDAIIHQLNELLPILDEWSHE